MSILQYMDWYNRARPHSSLGKKTPDEAYAVMLPTEKQAARESAEFPLKILGMLFKRVGPLLIAEESILIDQIGEWVLEEAYSQATYLYKTTGKLLPVSINVSPRQFYNSKLIDMIDSVLEKTDLHPSCLEIEITEGTLVNQISKFTTILKNLKVLGIKLAIDDFGIDYSSMSYLKNFPIDHLKIDRSFVRN